MRRKASIRPRKPTCFVDKKDFKTVLDAVNHTLLHDHQRIQSKSKDISELQTIGELDLFEKLNISDSSDTESESSVFSEINEEAMDNCSEESSDEKEEDEDEVCYVKRFKRNKKMTKFTGVPISLLE